MSEELKPCPTPWCGAHNERYIWQGPDDLFKVICDGCQVEGPAEYIESEAKDEWNDLCEKSPKNQVLALVDAARDAGDVLESASRAAFLDPNYNEEIKRIGERIGYGALMSGASVLWRESLGELAGAEFAVGPCVSQVQSRLVRLDDALMPFRGSTLTPIEGNTP